MRLYLSGIMLVVFIASQANAANPKDIKLIESITKNVKELCQAPSSRGKFMDFQIKGGGEVQVKLLKLLGSPRASAKATFDKGEWEGVQKVLQSQQAYDNANYRQCAEKLTPLFLKKFANRYITAKSNGNNQNSPSDNKFKRQDTDEQNKQPASIPPLSQVMINSPGSIQANNSNLYVQVSPPRRLTKEAKALFITYLKANPKGKVKIYLAAHGSEPSDFATDILDALKESGWDAYISSEIPIIPTTAKGIGLIINKEQAVPFSPIYHLQQAFDRINSKALAEIDNKIPKDEITLAIGNKPE